MDALTIDTEVLIARGRYATLRSEWKDLKSNIQKLSQATVDNIKFGLQYDSRAHFYSAVENSQRLVDWQEEANELKKQLDELRPLAWCEK